MRRRYFLAVLAVVVVLAPAFAAAQSPALPRTPWGAPDLQGCLGLPFHHAVGATRRARGQGVLD